MTAQRAHRFPPCSVRGVICNDAEPQELLCLNTRSIAIANHHPRLRLDRRAVTRVISTLDAHAADFRGGCPPGELSLVFMTDAALAQLHADFLDDPSITDVITFEGDAALGTAGEICVSADAALRQTGLATIARSKTARMRARTPALPVGAAKASASHLQTAARQREFSAELTLYLVHGWLHLAGYDDLVPAKKRAMRRAETRAMRCLRQDLARLPEFSLLETKRTKGL